MLSYLLEYIPHNSFYNFSRTKPSIPLNKLKIKGELLALTNEDLKFTLVILPGYIRTFNCGVTTPFINTNIGVFAGNLSGCTSGELWAPSPAGADVTADGVPDILIHNGRDLYCIRSDNGEIEWQEPQTGLLGSPVIADFDNDSELEIVVTGRPVTGSHRAKIGLYEHTCKEKWNCIFPVSSTGSSDPIANEACLADVDGDGELEIIAIDVSCYMVCLDNGPTGVQEDKVFYNSIRLINSFFKDEIRFFVPKLE